MPPNLGPKALKLKKGDILCKMKVDTSAVCWKDKREVYLLTNMHKPPASGRFMDEEDNVPKPLCIESYNRNMGFVDMSGEMVNSYSISWNTWKWTRICSCT
jgi:hypothetical protein